MSIGAYLSTKSELDNYEKHKRIEYEEIETVPEIEKQEIRDIYTEKGFQGELLEQIVEVITADKDRWVDVMMKEELELIPESKSPLAMGAVTYLSFVIIGIIPLTSYVFAPENTDSNQLFFLSCVLASIGFMFIGWLKAKVTDTSIVKAVLETLILGGSAAFVSYFVGDILEKLIAG